MSGTAPVTAGTTDAGSGGEGGVAGETLPLEHASCADLAMTCGKAQSDCCDSPEIPGGTFTRYTAGSGSVSGFRLDRFEVTVGRFRAFTEHYADALPAPHAGKNPHDAEDAGWDPAWNAELLPSATELMAKLDCSLRFATWDDEPGENENRPINCVTWYEAEAFCIWDGGRLPSDLEWEYAAQGGDEHRQFPWGSTIDPSPSTFANSYKMCGNGPEETRPECKGLAQIWLVGSAPAGDGRWHQSDLAGNLWEHTVDYFGPALACADCARHVPDAPATGQKLSHVSRGGAFNLALGDGLVSRDFYYPPGPRDQSLGFRCAYESKLK